MEGDYVLIYGWLQDVLRSRAIPDFDRRIDAILKYCRFGLSGGCTGCHRPGGLDQEAETVARRCQT